MNISRLLLLFPFVLTCATQGAGPATSKPPVVILEPYSDQTLKAGDLQRLMTEPGPGRDEKMCYSMRSYRFRRPDAKSDATELESYSTCQAANMFSMRDAAAPPPSATSLGETTVSVVR